MQQDFQQVNPVLSTQAVEQIGRIVEGTTIRLQDPNVERLTGIIAARRIADDVKTKLELLNKKGKLPEPISAEVINVVSDVVFKSVRERMEKNRLVELSSAGHQLIVQRAKTEAQRFYGKKRGVAKRAQKAVKSVAGYLPGSRR